MCISDAWLRVENWVAATLQACGCEQRILDSLCLVCMCARARPRWGGARRGGIERGGGEERGTQR